MPAHASFLHHVSAVVSRSIMLRALMMTTITVALNGVMARAQQSAESLAAAAQNPVAAMYSLSLENSAYFNVGPYHDKTANALDIQPVLPFTVGNWNIISRTIAPLVYRPSLSTGVPGVRMDSLLSNSHFGLGDIDQTVYFSPANAQSLIWGVGPSVSLPTATTKSLGTGKFNVGPAAVALVMPTPWVIGVLGRQLWSVAGQNYRQDVRQLMLQPFANYNFGTGWYLASSPVITSNWNASSRNRWTIPIGGGIGKIFKIGSQAMNAQIQAFDYPIRPTGGPQWAIRFQIQFLFPR